MKRPNWDEYGIILATAVATRADCTRRQVGAVLLSPDHRVLSTGYNGSAPGGPSCLAGGCPRGAHGQYPGPGSEQWTCLCGRDWPCELAVPPGSSYDTGLGSCIALHAEQNAILWADPASRVGATMCITDAPCDGCTRLINGVGIARVVTPDMLGIGTRAKVLTLVSKLKGLFGG